MLIDLAADRRADGRVRKLIRMGLAAQARALAARDPQREQEIPQQMASYPLDWTGDHANRQHYEVPPEFFVTVLGPHLKYSCCLWDGADSLAAAEAAMLDAVIRRADVTDGQRILDLGCGWGALALALAERFPNAEVIALSGSGGQRRFIEARRDKAGYRNLKVVTADVAHWEGDGAFDRILSVEMFEHIRNWPALLRRIAGWMAPDALLFVHVFCHAHASYFFEDDITARYFFTGGLMPAADLLPQQARGFSLRNQWTVSGAHYRQTAEAWLANLDAHAERALAALAGGVDPRPAAEQFAAWRLFFMITAESFGYGEGAQWLVRHYLFAREAA
jgi:cyclopropane-fatty-acyl-phospholipid synthase